jgi:hypothetical protein
MARQRTGSDLLLWLNRGHELGRSKANLFYDRRGRRESCGCTVNWLPQPYKVSSFLADLLIFNFYVNTCTALSQRCVWLPLTHAHQHRRMYHHPPTVLVAAHPTAKRNRGFDKCSTTNIFETRLNWFISPRSMCVFVQCFSTLPSCLAVQLLRHHHPELISRRCRM